jgi:hypothetical protein
MDLPISGFVGYSYLKYEDKDNYDIKKELLLLADIHDGVSYCKQKSTMIDEFLTLNDKHTILLEETVREQVSLTDLWPNSIHTQRLKVLNNNNNKIIPVDIRSLLIPFSWELLEDPNYDKRIADISFKQYLRSIDNIFYLSSSSLMTKYIAPQMKKMKECEKNEEMRKRLLLHFEEMKKNYIEFIEKNKTLNDTSILEIYKIDNKKGDTEDKILEEINEISSMIMEWYIILLILNSKRKTIVHIGLAHSDRVLAFLTEVYLFKLIKQSGINTMEEINDDPIACSLLPQDITESFAEKLSI